MVAVGLEPEGNSGSAKLFLATDSAKFIKLDLQRLQEVTVTVSVPFPSDVSCC